MDHIILTFTADYLFGLMAITASILLLKLQINRGEYLVRGFIAAVCALIIDKSSGLVYYHKRPFIIKGIQAGALNPNNNAFPSDHALLVFTAALVVWIATKNWKYGLLILLGGVAVGTARVVAQVHWTIDIIGSFVIASAMVVLWFNVPLPQRMRHFAQKLDAWLDKKLPVLR